MTARLLTWLAGLALALSLGGCGTLSRMPVDEDLAPARRLAETGDLGAEVEAVARPAVEQGRTPGIVVGVLSPDGSRHFYHYGVADKDSNAEVDEQTLFAIGSLSKGFLAEITAQLVREHRLEWSDTLEELLPGARLSPAARRITVLQLATHTSGLPRQPWTPQSLAYFLRYLFTGDSFYRQIDSQYILDYLAGFKAPAETSVQYSNIGYGLLSHIVSTRTGQSVDALLRRHVLDPLGLAHTAYEPDAAQDSPPRARGHAGDQPKFIPRGQPVPDWRFTEAMRGSAALYSNAADLLTYAGAHLYRQHPDVDDALQDALEVRFRHGKEGAGLAWSVDEIRGRKLAYQVGFVAGYSSYIGLDVENRTAVVVLQNSFNWTGIGHRLLMRMADARELRRE